LPHLHCGADIYSLDRSGSRLSIDGGQFPEYCAFPDVAETHAPATGRIDAHPSVAFDQKQNVRRFLLMTDDGLARLELSVDRPGEDALERGIVEMLEKWNRPDVFQI
jgi:hypothetical protein